MAIFHLQIKPVTRSAGRTATAAAAYRAGERIRDERTGALYNHEKRDDVLHKEIFLPSRLDLSDAAMEWARDRSRLWNAAEKAERQSNSRVAREYLAALPAELSAEQRAALARTFSREIADRYNVAVDLAIHAPRPEGDPRNFHAHLLATTREVTPEGLGPKTGLDMEGGVRSELGLPPSRQEFKALRARWAELTNEALKEANLEARVDHRSLRAQGIDREPRPRLPWGAIAAERRGERSEVAERIRGRQQARLQARQAEAAGQTRAPVSGPPPDMEARRRQAVQDWLKYRAGLEGAGHAEEARRSPPLSMDEIRRQAVAAWRRLQARGAESPPTARGRRERDGEREREEPGQTRDTPGIGDDFSV
ncbi:MAG TPA: MobQ family relaxase [Steroidobacteraceae bacterium]|nr:MobQ family relaxase [Steroidobacteraceae bacterium]